MMVRGVSGMVPSGLLPVLNLYPTAEARRGVNRGAQEPYGRFGAVTERLECEVCVVGAGFAGLTAAHRLAQRGVAVVVLEARSRVGGRIWTEHLDDGSVI